MGRFLEINLSWVDPVTQANVSILHAVKSNYDRSCADDCADEYDTATPYN